MQNNCDSRAWHLSCIACMCRNDGNTVTPPTLLHTDKECDTSVVLLVYSPCMVVAVSSMVTSSPSHDTVGPHAKLYDPVGEVFPRWKLIPEINIVSDKTAAAEEGENLKNEKY